MKEFAAKQVREAIAHTCHAIGCNTACPPRFLMCGRHWAMVPKPLQNAVYAAYRRGQCDDMRPSAAWWRAAADALEAVLVAERGPLEQRRCPESGEVAMSRETGMMRRMAWRMEQSAGTAAGEGVAGE